MKMVRLVHGVNVYKHCMKDPKRSENKCIEITLSHLKLKDGYTQEQMDEVEDYIEDHVDL